MNQRRITMWLGIWVSLACGIVYMSLAADHLVDRADSAELITAAYFRGVAHPPSYPGYIQLLHGLMHSLSGISPYTVSHYFSSILQAINVGLVFFLMTRYLERLHLKLKWWEQLMIATGTSLAVGMSFYWLDLSSYAEVFPLHFLLVLLLFLGMTSITKKVLYGIALLCGLGVAHHQSFLFLLPSLIWVLAKNHVQGISIRLLILAGFIGFVVPNLLLLTSVYDAPLSWKFEPTLQGYASLLSREIYQLNAYTPLDETGSEWLWSRLKSVWLLLEVGQKSYLYLAMPLALLALGLLRRNRMIVIPLLVAWLLSGPFFAGLMNVQASMPPANEYELYTLGLSTRLMSTSGLITGILAGLGMAFLMHLMIGRMTHLRGLIGTLFLVWPLGLGIVHYPALQARGDMHDTKELATILKNLPQQAVLIVDNDSAFALIALQSIEQIRPDVLLVPSAAHMRWEFLLREIPEEVLMASTFNQFIAGLAQWSESANRPFLAYDPRSLLLRQAEVMGYAPMVHDRVVWFTRSVVDESQHRSYRPRQVEEYQLHELDFLSRYAVVDHQKQEEMLQVLWEREQAFRQEQAPF